jgi:O-antigen ligase
MVPASGEFRAADHQSVARWAVLGLAVAATVGSTAVFDDRVAFALTVVIVLLSAIAIRPSTSILLLLSGAVFVESIKISGTQISRLLAPVALTVILIEILRGGARVRANPTLLWVAAYAVWAFASGLWTADLGGTSSFLASLAIAFVFMLGFAAFVDSPRELERVLLVAASVAFVIAFISIAAYLHWFTLIGATVRDGRAQGGTGDPNYFANLQLVVLPFVLALVPQGRKAWHRYLLCFAALVIIGSVLASTSRGGILGLMVVGLLITLLPARTLLASPRQKGLVMLVLVAGTALCFTLPTFRHGVTSRVATIFQTNEVSGTSGGSGRTDTWRAAQKAFARHPILGIGAGSFPHVSNDLMLETPGVDLVTYALRPNGAEVHNTFLGTVAELGLPGLALFLGLLISAAAGLRRASVRARRAGLSFVHRVANAALVSMAGWAVTSFFLESETSRPIWIVIGLSLALAKLVPAGALSDESADRAASDRARR